MKRIGIITIDKVNNYGAELQAYATQRALQIMGYDAEIIDYPFYKDPRHIATQSSRTSFPMLPVNRLKEYLYPRFSRIRSSLLKDKNESIRRERFENFHRKNTKFSREFRSMDDLFGATLSYDAYIVGSDQVWNPGNFTSLDPYFLKFAPKDKKKISYGSSFGVSSLPNCTIPYYRDALMGLTAISVRENTAVRMVKQISGRDAQCVLDPTLLLNADEWKKIAIKMDSQQEDRYVLLYELTPCPYLRTLATHIAMLKKIKVVKISSEGPGEFLWLIENASFIVTDSFHGIAFSINMNKDFYAVVPSRKKNGDRQKSILNLLGLSDRLLKEDSVLPEKESLAIDYSQANARLETERIKSKNFLRRAIDG